jgi:Cytochrome P460
MKLFNVAVFSVAGSAAVLAMAALAFAASGPAVSGSDSAVASAKVDMAVDRSGKLHVPANYRTTYQFMGTWAVANDQGPGAAEMHVLYASPGTIAAYRKDGHFPDGAVLVKEVYRAATEPMTTGTVSHVDSLRGWFVMVRDRNGHHGANEVWGDGWGWSWFDADNTAVASRNLPMKDGIVRPTFDYKQNCKACHAPAAATEWIYTEGYPPLKR